MLASRANFFPESVNKLVKSLWSLTAEDQGCTVTLPPWVGNALFTRAFRQQFGMLFWLMNHEYSVQPGIHFHFYNWKSKRMVKREA